MKNSTFDGKVNLIGTDLKALREKEKCSQEQLCSKLSLLGITLYKNDIYRIETNKRTVKDFELWGIAKVLCFSIDELFEKI